MFNTDAHIYQASDLGDACEEYVNKNNLRDNVKLVHLVKAVGQRGEALHVGQSQQAAEKAMQGGLVLPLLLELLSQLKQALPPHTQHPQSQPEPALPPIRALQDAQDESALQPLHRQLTTHTNSQSVPECPVKDK